MSAERVGPYRLEGELGSGGTGVVYRAVHDDGEIVALKVLRSELAGDETFRKRFLREARAAQEVVDPHLVPVVDLGEADGRPYLASEFVEGGSLAARLAAGPLVQDELLRVAAGVAAGLDALHRAGLVHRDVKPANIMLDDDGGARLTDFGLAKGRAYTVLTRSGQVLGTLDYMPPEAIKGEEATPASDVYSLGCVVYECVAGKPPFAGKGMFEIGMAHLEEEPPEPCPAPLGWAVLQALRKDPADRPPTATAYSTMLRVAARENPPA